MASGRTVSGWFVVAVALAASALSQTGCRSSASVPAAPTNTTPSVQATEVLPATAELLLSLEHGGTDHAVQRIELQTTVNLAVARFRTTQPAEPETELQTALRFFRIVDRAMIDRGYVFPPRGLVELLHQSLEPRVFSAAEFDQCLARPENRPRAATMKRIRAKGGRFHVVDCDVASLIYLSAAERLSLPVRLVQVPNHMFVRWSTPRLACNWDPNTTIGIPDDVYAESCGVTPEGRIHLGWLEDMTQARVISTWMVTIARWHERYGRHAEALAAYRRAVESDPSDLEAENALAWFRATCPVAQYRNAGEAETIARRLVAIWPRPAWADTLAAAQAERGDFAGAIATKQNLPRPGIPSTGDIRPQEPDADADDAVRAYAKRMTYAQGVAAGIIYTPRANLPYDD